jgi:hypothetical protein
MLKNVWSCVSLKERFTFAAMFYLGVGVLMLAITPDLPKARADTNCGTCPSPQVCVQVDESTWECQCP